MENLNYSDSRKTQENKDFLTELNKSLDDWKVDNVEAKTLVEKYNKIKEQIDWKKEQDKKQILAITKWELSNLAQWLDIDSSSSIWKTLNKLILRSKIKAPVVDQAPVIIKTLDKELEIKYLEKYAAISKDIKLFLSDVFWNELSGSLWIFNEKEFSNKDNQEWFSDYEKQLFVWKIDAAINRMNLLWSYNEFKKSHNDATDYTISWSNKDKFLADKLNMWNQVASVIMSKINNEVWDFSNISEEKLHKMREAKFDITSVDSMKDFFILIWVEVWEWLQDIIKMILNIPSWLILSSRYISNMIDIDWEVDTNKEAKLKIENERLLEKNPALALIELLPNWLTVLKQLWSKMVSWKNWDVAFWVVSIVWLLAWWAWAAKLLWKTARVAWKASKMNKMVKVWTALESKAWKAHKVLNKIDDTITTWGLNQIWKLSKIKNLDNLPIEWKKEILNNELSEIHEKIKVLKKWTEEYWILRNRWAEIQALLTKLNDWENISIISKAKNKKIINNGQTEVLKNSEYRWLNKVEIRKLTDEERLFNSIFTTNSFDELTDLINQQWKIWKYSADYLIDAINKFKNWEIEDLTYITKKWWLRDKVALLSNNDFVRNNRILHKLWPKWLDNVTSQGEVWNCYFVAALNSLKNHPEWWKMLANMIKIVDGNVFVKFKGVDETIEITQKMLNDMWDAKITTNNLWDLILERAHANIVNKQKWWTSWKTMFQRFKKWEDYYDLIHAMWNSDDVYKHFFWKNIEARFIDFSLEEWSAIIFDWSKPVWRQNASWKKYLLDNLDKNNLNTISSLTNDWKRDIDFYIWKDLYWKSVKLAHSHAYTIYDFNKKDWWITVVNPQDTSKPIKFKISDFDKYFSGITIWKFKNWDDWLITKKAA